MDFDIIKGYLLLEGFKVISNDLYDIYYSEDFDVTLYFSSDTKKLLEIHYYYYNENINITKFKNLPFVLSKQRRNSEYWIKLHLPIKGFTYISNSNELCFRSERSFPIKLNPKDFLNYLNIMI